MSAADLSRRDFLHSSSALLGGTWFAFHHPAVLRAALHARAAVAVGSPAFEVLTPEEATELEAIAAQIFPSDESPGAREAGVIHFMDRAFGTFAANLLTPVRGGLNELHVTVAERFAGQWPFSAGHLPYG